MNPGKRIIYDPDTLLSMADRSIQLNDWVSSWVILNGIIYEFPWYGPAYNHKGWLFVNVMDNREEAEMNYQLALEKNPAYPATYVNYASLLNTMNKFEKLEVILNKALLVDGVDMVKIYTEWGIMREKMQYFDEAINDYVEAIKFTIQTENVDYLNDAINRCKTKINIFRAVDRIGIKEGRVG